jgi:hypothetical protein
VLSLRETTLSGHMSRKNFMNSEINSQIWDNTDEPTLAHPDLLMNVFFSTTRQQAKNSRKFETP